MVAEAEILMVGEEAEVVVVALDEEDVGDQITTMPTTTIMPTGMLVNIRNNNTITTNHNSRHHLSNSKVNLAMILRTKRIEDRELP